jgi:hypothetical protein
MTLAEVTTDEAGERANSAGIALALDKHEGADCCRGSHGRFDGNYGAERQDMTITGHARAREKDRPSLLRALRLIRLLCRAARGHDHVLVYPVREGVAG